MKYLGHSCMSQAFVFKEKTNPLEKRDLEDEASLR